MKEYLFILVSIFSILFIACSKDELRSEESITGPGGYLLVHMNTDKRTYGNLYYSVSRNGINWQRLYYDGYRICTFKGHPNLCKGRNNHWYMIGVKDEAPVLWGSSDLVHWNIEKIFSSDLLKASDLNLGTDFEWFNHPRIFYDDRSDKYLITWDPANADLVEKDSIDYQMSLRTCYIETSDFETFTSANYLFENGGIYAGIATRDVSIQRVGDKYYCFFTGRIDSKECDVYRGESNNFSGPYSNIQIITNGQGSFEYPTAILKDDNSACLLYVQKDDEYICLESSSIAGNDFRVENISISARMATIIRIDENTYQKVVNAYEGTTSETPTKRDIQIINIGNGFELQVEGRSLYMKGIGVGNDGFDKLNIASQCGANIYRTWGANTIEEVQQQIDRAAANKMYVMPGIWLGEIKNGYYSNESYKKQVREYCGELARKFKDDPTVLAWALGNEINTGMADGGGEVWRFIDELAQIIKSIDKRHLVCTIINHSSTALDCIGNYTSNLDFIGINSYGSIKGVKSMIGKSTYQGAYIISEFGPRLPMEVAKTSWGVPIEQNSEEKRKAYEEAYNLQDERCIGSFAFTWQGSRIERTPTWFNMFATSGVDGLPLNGERTSAVEAMQRCWTGKEPDQTAPRITNMTINNATATANVKVKKGATMQVKVIASDLENNKLTYYWEILSGDEKSETAVNKRPERVGNIVKTENPEATLSIPQTGTYRVFVYILDGTGYMSTANIPILVE